MERWLHRVAVVTGASQGIGAAITRQLAARGMRVVGLDTREDLLKELEKDLTSKNCFVKSYVCDVTNDEQVKETFAWVEKKVGPVSVLVNNAGLYKALPMTNLDVAGMRTTINVNLLGVLETTKYGLDSMMRNNIKDGHIINMSSLAAHKEFPVAGGSVYAATKCGVSIINKNLKKELSDENSKIRVTCISPGFAKTALTTWYTDEFKDRPCLGPKDIADTVIYALSTPANVNITEILLEPV